MNYTVSEVLRFVEENDVKFIRLAFCDIFGVQKNISIMPSELPRAFDTGISFDASSIDGFMNIEESDLFLVPDPSTLSILPWRPSRGRVVRFFCHIKYPDGRNFEGDGRYILKTVLDELKEMKYVCK
ncbi:MAG TPA: glutamine synthetase beta-grasp domain-containing protein, partial [Candidatus Fimicola cottocaccae]|nr:glutamine synthetase beta-grasp domain-containing protein [Candidatus Fimicola cottocaccae]